MSEIVERAARALCENPSEYPDEPTMMMHGEAWPRWRAEVWRVEAVLSAIRNPTPDMLTGAAGVGEEAADYPTAVWQAMIDAALGDEVANDG